LEKAQITVNKNMVPFDTESPFVTSGIRIGSPAMTTRGLKEAEFTRIAELIDLTLSNPTNEDILYKVGSEVNEICTKYPLYNFVTV